MGGCPRIIQISGAWRHNRDRTSDFHPPSPLTIIHGCINAREFRGLRIPYDYKGLERNSRVTTPGAPRASHGVDRPRLCVAQPWLSQKC